MIESYAISDRGGRAENQDRVLADHTLGVFAVADGMGGHRAGSVAAELAMSTLRYYLESSADRGDVSWPFGYSFDVSEDGNRLATGIRLAHRYVLRKAETSPEYAGMGTTMAALLLHDQTSTVANVGDSRVYHFRDGALTQLTKDDTMSESQLGSLIADEDSRRQMRNVLMQAIGAQESLDVHVHEQAMQPGDMLLLTSDGLHVTLGDDSIRSILCQGVNVERMAEDLLEAAIERDASDNVSIVLLVYDM